jgi:hypothetical protein
MNDTQTRAFTRTDLMVYAARANLRTRTEGVAVDLQLI